MSAVTPEIIRCAACGANNRVRPEQAGQAVCGRCKSPLAAPARPALVTDGNFHSVVEQSPLPVLLDLWADWCGPCRMVAPVIEQLAAELAGRVRVGKLNVDQNPATAARFGVQSIPTLLILKGGREAGRIVGAQPKGEILRQLQAVL